VGILLQVLAYSSTFDSHPYYHCVTGMEIRREMMDTQTVIIIVGAYLLIFGKHPLIGIFLILLGIGGFK